MTPRTLTLCFSLLCVPACALPDETGTIGDEPSLVNNAPLTDIAHEGHYYREMVQAFAATQGVATSLRLAQLTAIWPIPEARTAVFTRLATPILFDPKGPYHQAYLHTAVDVFRSTTDVVDTIVAPTAGLAVALNWFGQPKLTVPYQTVVLLWDPASHVFFHMMHVAPSAKLLANPGTPVEVLQGEPLGKISALNLATPEADRLRHVHFAMIDGEHLTMLDPSAWLPYHDRISPTLQRAYVLDAKGQARTQLSKGALDIVVEGYDRDDDSNRNFELAALQATIVGDDGTVYYRLPRCQLADLVTDLQPQATATNAAGLQMIDFRNATSQIQGAWPGSDNDNDNRQRTMRYVLTQLAVVGGRCALRDGALTLPPQLKGLTVQVTAWDPRENWRSMSFPISR